MKSKLGCTIPWAQHTGSPTCRKLAQTRIVDNETRDARTSPRAGGFFRCSGVILPTKRATHMDTEQQSPQSGFFSHHYVRNMAEHNDETHTN